MPNTVNTIIEYDPILKMYEVIFTENFSQELAVFSTPDQADRFFNELLRQGYVQV